MSRFKTLFAVLMFAAIAGSVPKASAVAAPTVVLEVSAAGSSAQWQSLALAAYNNIPNATTKGHWTSASNAVNLSDSRFTPANVDAGTLWVVWSCSVATCLSGTIDYWIFDKVDSVVGDRCFFAQPACAITVPSATQFATTTNNKIKNFLFKDQTSDTTVPAAVQAKLTAGVPVLVAATDIRHEDAMFAMCRANSTLGTNTGGVHTTDNLDGLGYNSNNAPGVCPATATTAQAVGSPVLSGMPGAPAGDQANVIAFNVVGHGTDPVNGTTIPLYTVVNVGAAPVVFIKSATSGLANLHNATPAQLAGVFSGTNCDANEFQDNNANDLPSAGLNIILREPTSGTFNTTEATVFRGPTVNANLGTATAPLGQSQELHVNGAVNNPLAGQAGTCAAGNANSARWRAIGTGESVAGVFNSPLTTGLMSGLSPFPTQQDGLAYTFFSFGNVNGLNDSTKYGYITLNGIDPIFATYNNGSGRGFDPAQPPSGELPGAADLGLAAVCNTGANGFPCPENQIWAGGLSFPNVRNGSYPAWSLLRAIAWNTGQAPTVSQLAALRTLITNAQKNVVAEVPDFIPYTAVTCPHTAGAATPWFVCPTGGATTGVKDPGLLVLRAHYLQTDGAGTVINTGTVSNYTHGAVLEAGGDMGGTIFNCTVQTTCPNLAAPTVSAGGVYLPQSQQVVWGVGVITSTTTGGYVGGFTVRP